MAVACQTVQPCLPLLAPRLFSPPLANMRFARPASMFVNRLLCTAAGWGQGWGAAVRVGAATSTRQLLAGGGAWQAIRAHGT